MRKYLVIVSLMICFCLAAEDATLNLDDIFIMGEAETISDSIAPVVDDPLYINFTEINDLGYEPEPVSTEIERIIFQKPVNSNMLHISGGSDSWILGKLQYQYPDKFSFLGRYFHNSTDEYHNTEELMISIKPQYKELEGYLEFEKLDYENKTLHNTVNAFSLKIPILKTDFPHSINIGSNNSLSEKLKPFLLPEETGLELSVIDYNLNSGSVYTISNEKSKTDVDARFYTSSIFRNLNSRLDLNYVSRNFSGELSVQLIDQNVKNIDKMGIWLGADEKRIIPSLQYTFFYSMKYGNIILQNDPEIKHYSRLHHLKNQNFLNDYFEFPAEKTPLNHTITFDTSLPVDFYWISRYTYDESEYYIFDFMEDIWAHYRSQDFFTNTLGAYFEQEYNGILFTDEIIYNIYSEDVRHKPAFEYIGKIKYKQSHFETALNLNYGTGYKNVFKNYLKDKVLVNADFRYNYGRYFTFLLAIDNILDRDFRLNSVEYKPEDSGITIRGGMNLHF